MPWPQDALSDDEEIITSFRPHWKLLFIPILWGLGVFVALLLVVAYVNVDVLPAVLIGGLVIVSLIFVVKPLVDWWVTRYVLTNERLITRTGLVAKSGIEIPLENITNVNFSQTVFERILGAGDLLIESAGSTGQSRFANIPHPDAFQTTLYRAREQRSMELSGSSRPSAAPAPPEPPDHAESIRKLAQLRDDGLISEEEYEAKRRQILDKM